MERGCGIEEETGVLGAGVDGVAGLLLLLLVLLVISLLLSEFSDSILIAFPSRLGGLFRMY